jgi:hypothetical protein
VNAVESHAVAHPCNKSPAPTTNGVPDRQGYKALVQKVERIVAVVDEVDTFLVESQGNTK